MAGLCFRVELPEDARVWPALSNYSPFAVEEEAEGDCIFSLHYRKDLPLGGRIPIPLPDAESPYETRLDVFCSADGDYIFDVAVNHFSPVAGHIYVSRDFRKGYVDSLESFVINNALMLIYAFASASRGVLEMHSSVVVNEGLAYMFLGVSGTGKSTHSSLWIRNIAGTGLLNDDNPVIRIEEDGCARVYGTPWSGKTPCYKNESAPIAAIVSLEQAPFNRIRELELPEAYADILSSCSGLKFDGGFMDTLHETIAQVASGVRCYHLQCLPDAEAALVCHKAVSPAAHCACVSMEIENEVLLSGASALLSEGRSVVLMTKGCSMLPFIRGSRDSVVLKRSEAYSRGDVVLARLAPGHWVLHRIASIDEDLLVLKGDGNLFGVERCRIGDVSGKVVAIQGRDGRERPMASADFWNRLPYIVRRIILGILRRILRCK